jgi:hypothetical protein
MSPYRKKEAVCMITTHRKEDKMIFRVPEGMREDLNELASANCRTLSGEMIFHLKKAIETHKAASGQAS